MGNETFYGDGLSTEILQMFVTLKHTQLTNWPQKTKKSRTRYRFYLDPINAVKTPKTA